MKQVTVEDIEHVTSHVPEDSPFIVLVGDTEVPFEVVPRLDKVILRVGVNYESQ